MSVTAYVLIQTEVGKSVKVAEAARGIDGVVSAASVTGPYDVIVHTLPRRSTISASKWCRRSRPSTASPARSRARW